jgi:poly(3-hydroxybutyrate) depolymerase
MVIAEGPRSGGPGSELPAGSGRFVFEDMSGNPGKPIPVWYHRAKGFAAGKPVVFVMHGRGRNADDYRDDWIALAEANDFLIAAPEFADEHFPGFWRYNIGNLFNATGERKPESVWVPTLIEKIFDVLRERYGVTAEKYDIFGHSAGAHVVHRMALFKSNNRIRTAISANSGWYTMLDEGFNIPYGIANAGLDEARLRDAFATKLIVLLGTADNDPHHPILRRTSEAMAQGQHRLERGRNFFKQATAKAAELGSPFAWRLEHAEGVGHDGRDMARFAAKFLADCD